MSREDWRNRCFNCMAQLNSREDTCPDCGWDNRNRVNGEGMLEQMVLENRYLIGRALGRGGFGVTYIGYDLNLKRRVAIKEFFPLTLSYRDMDATTVRPYSANIDEYNNGLERARNEGQTVVNLGRVPNIVQVYDVLPLQTAGETDGTTNGTVYIVMEYIDGTTLSELVKRDGRMGWKPALGMLLPIMRALEKVHEQGIIHRDVSPDNIMLSRKNNETVLLDFGAAREASQSLTATLKPGYAPIEQYSDHSAQDGRVDEYALCGTMYFLLTGRAPESADLRAYVKRELKTPRSLGCDIPPKVEAVLLKGMSVDRENRYASIGALRAAFEEAMGKRKNGFVRALIVVMVMAIMGTAGFYGWKMLKYERGDSGADRKAATDVAVTSDADPTPGSEAGQTETQDGGTDVESEATHDAPTPTPEPFINHYGGEMPSWPTGDEAMIIGLWRQDAHDIPHAVQAFDSAMAVADVSRYGQWVVPKSDEAVTYFNRLLDGEFNGIILFPYAGVDYTECIQAAAQANIAVYVILEDNAEDIFNEICGLYGIKDHVPHLDGNVPWPQKSDAAILVYYNGTDAQDEEVTGAVNDALGMVGYDFDAGHLFGVSQGKDKAVKTLESYLSEGLGEDYPDLEAVCVLPYGDVDYSSAIEIADEKGIAIHFIDAVQPSDIVKSICDLYKDAH